MVCVCVSVSSGSLTVGKQIMCSVVALYSARVKVSLAGLFTIVETAAGDCAVWDLLFVETMVKAARCVQGHHTHTQTKKYHSDAPGYFLRLFSSSLHLKHLTILTAAG